jgi:hypothetical protein
LTTLPGLRYSSGHRKGRLKILSIQLVATFNFVIPEASGIPNRGSSG